MTVLTVAAIHSGRYLHWGVISISLTNALIIGLMVVLFLLALFVPLGRSRGHGTGSGRQS